MNLKFIDTLNGLGPLLHWLHKLQAWLHTPFEDPLAMADSCLGAAGIAVINYVATLAMYLPVVVL